MIEQLRNIAIVAHVDHGKTTLVDALLRQSHTLPERGGAIERVMDTADLERERGITILSKNTAIDWHGTHINIVDTPGHADFGGEVERVLSMVDSVLLLVDAADGPMPQTRFVLQKALAQGFRPIVTLNKIDRAGARAAWALDQTFDLFDNLGADETQLDFTAVYTSALGGYAGLTADVREGDMTPLFEIIRDHVPAPKVAREGPLQLQVSSLDYSSYLGVIGIGRITRGQVHTNTQVSVVDRHGRKRQGRILQIFGFLGLERVAVDEARAGDIIAFTGIPDLAISDTVCAPDKPEALPPLTVDQPTVAMTFQVNTSPFAGRDGRFITSRQIRERLQQELKHNVALRVEDTDDPERFRVSGRGELHLGILIERMRREGYELGVSRPEVLMRDNAGTPEEPYERLAVDVAEDYQGAVMERLGSRGGELTGMLPDGKGRVRIDYIIPARGLIGFRTEFLTATSGTGIMHHVFDHYGRVSRAGTTQRNNGALVAMSEGKAIAYALFNLQERGRLFVSAGDAVYEGMIIGLHNRANDLVVNPMKAKQLTNVRAAGSDESVILTPIQPPTLEQALEVIDDDELVEVTPKAIRLRKRFLKEHERKKAARASG